MFNRRDLFWSLLIGLFQPTPTVAKTDRNHLWNSIMLDVRASDAQFALLHKWLKDHEKESRTPLDVKAFECLNKLEDLNESITRKIRELRKVLVGAK